MIKSRLPDVGTTIFTVMSKMAKDYNAINLSQGYPDFPIDSKLIELVNKYMLAGNNQYAPMPGSSELLDSIISVISTTYGRTCNAANITVTSGATEALYASITAIVNPGDEVIVFDPSYDAYDPAIRLNGGVPIHVNLYPPLFKIDWNRVNDWITARTKMIIINTPHNPTGSVLSLEDLKQLEEITIKHGLIVLSDEVYERIIFNPNNHHSVLSLEALAARSIAVFSFGKTFHATGWRVGYAVAPEELMKEIQKIHQFISFSVITPVQLALAEYLKDADNYQNIGSFYQQKRDFFLEQLKGSSFEPLSSAGTYFQLVSYRNISSYCEREMAEELAKKHGVAAIPVSVFYKENLNQYLLRFCFAKQESTLYEAGKILRQL